MLLRPFATRPRDMSVTTLRNHCIERVPAYRDQTASNEIFELSNDARVLVAVTHRLKNK